VSGLLDKRVVVLAGYGPGLGAALASRAAAEGAQLVIASRTADKLEEAAETLRGEGATVLPVATDVNDEAACEALV
jgi:NADP-dependent 3-hydroxy acid dehydrogenase YdfG